MSIKIIRFDYPDKELFKEAAKIRTKVFIEEQNTDFGEEFDGKDEEAIHYLVYYKGKPAATGRRRITNEGHKLERFAVYKEFRGKHLAVSLMNEMLNDVLPTDKIIYLNAQAYAEKFYEKFGFKKVGEMFFEANIEHYKMIYQKQKQ